MKIHNFIKEHPQMQENTTPIMELITGLRVRVNNKIVRRNKHITLARDTVEWFDTQVGEWVLLPHEIKRTLILLNKPRGYLCTHNDPFDRDIIYQLLPEQFQQLRSCGRLDQDSEGLLILTDDGYFLFAHTSPKFPCSKTYLVGISQPLPQEMIERAASGNFVIERNGELQHLLPVAIDEAPESIMNEFAFLNLPQELHWYTFVLVEGRYNQIRKMCAQYGTPLSRLIRIQHGEYRLNEKLYATGYEVLSTKKLC